MENCLDLRSHPCLAQHKCKLNDWWIRPLQPSNENYHKSLAEVLDLNLKGIRKLSLKLKIIKKHNLLRMMILMKETRRQKLKLLSVSGLFWKSISHLRKSLDKWQPPQEWWPWKKRKTESNWTWMLGTKTINIFNSIYWLTEKPIKKTSMNRLGFLTLSKR